MGVSDFDAHERVQHEDPEHVGIHGNIHRDTHDDNRMDET
jgi:hypothetical protein